MRGNARVPVTVPVSVTVPVYWRSGWPACAARWAAPAGCGPVGAARCTNGSVDRSLVAGRTNVNGSAGDGTFACSRPGRRHSAPRVIDAVVVPGAQRPGHEAHL